MALQRESEHKHTFVQYIMPTLSLVQKDKLTQDSKVLLITAKKVLLYMICVKNYAFS